MVEAKGYSIWMIPSGQVYNDLSGLISKLSGDYMSPKFEPHVTLIGGLDGLQEDILFKTSGLAKIIKPLKVELEGLDRFDDDPFRCLFIKAKETPELMDANSKAKRVFSRAIDAVYAPHLSLIYGTFSKDMKDKIISDIGKDAEGKELAFTFDADKLHLFSTQGEPDKWYRVREFPLTG